MHVGSSLPALRPKAGRVYPHPEGYKRKKLREMDRDKQSSKHTFGAWSDPTNKFVDGWMASHRSVILVQLPDDSSLAGNGNSNCSSRFSSSSSRLGSAPNCGFRRITCSAALRGPRRYSSCAAKAVVPHLTACWHSTLWRTQQHVPCATGTSGPGRDNKRKVMIAVLNAVVLKTLDANPRRLTA